LPVTFRHRRGEHNSGPGRWHLFDGLDPQFHPGSIQPDDGRLGTASLSIDEQYLFPLALPARGSGMTGL
jgi:hypothetical protein